jgi:hypothetical protein
MIVFAVIARSESDEAIQTPLGPWIAWLALAMTGVFIPDLLG